MIGTASASLRRLGRRRGGPIVAVPERGELLLERGALLAQVGEIRAGGDEIAVHLLGAPREHARDRALLLGQLLGLHPLHLEQHLLGTQLARLGHDSYPVPSSSSLPAS